MIRALERTSWRCSTEKSGESLGKLMDALSATPTSKADSLNALAPPAPWWITSSIPAAAKASDTIVRRRDGYTTPSLSTGLVDDGDTMGTRDPPAT
eukprot:2697146-Prymnesium_polylepis.2